MIQEGTIYCISAQCTSLTGMLFPLILFLSGGEQAANELCGFLISPFGLEPPRKQSDTSEMGLPTGTAHFD